MSTVYLLHFDRPFGHARHYLGWASNLDARLRHHEEGTGANLLKHARAAGVTWTLARTWDGDRHLERRMHNGGHARRCPMCKEWARTSREVLDVLVDGVHTGGSPIQIGAHAMKNAWFTVFTKDDVTVVERYLYGHTTIVRSGTVEQYGKTYTIALLETTADTQERVDYLARYQADRLASGLHGTSPVRVVADEALDDLAARTGVRL